MLIMGHFMALADCYRPCARMCQLLLILGIFTRITRKFRILELKNKLQIVHNLLTILNNFSVTDFWIRKSN